MMNCFFLFLQEDVSILIFSRKKQNKNIKFHFNKIHQKCRIKIKCGKFKFQINGKILISFPFISQIIRIQNNKDSTLLCLFCSKHRIESLWKKEC